MQPSMALALYDWPYRQTVLKFPKISDSVAVDLANDENFEGETDPFAAKEAHCHTYRNTQRPQRPL